MDALDSGNYVKPGDHIFLRLVEIEDARMASEVTEVLMGTEVPPRKAFIYEHARDAELDI